jgi:uncharacterized membrane protein (DUF485 family)
MAGASAMRWPLFKDALLIVRPIAAWNRLAAEARSVPVTFFIFFLPLLLLVSYAEGIGLTAYFNRHLAASAINRLDISKLLVYEGLEIGVLLFIIIVSASFIKMFGNACHRRNTLAQSLTLLLHALGPMLLIQLFNVIPGMNPWLTWSVGMVLTLGALYHGIPRILQPDAPSALGLFLGGALVVFMLLFLGRLFCCWFLLRQFRPLENILSLFTMKFF